MVTTYPPKRPGSLINPAKAGALQPGRPTMASQPNRPRASMSSIYEVSSITTASIYPNRAPHSCVRPPRLRSVTTTSVTIAPVHRPPRLCPPTAAVLSVTTTSSIQAIQNSQVYILRHVFLLIFFPSAQGRQYSPPLLVAKQRRDRAPGVQASQSLPARIRLTNSSI